jgi:peptide/nickel transport system permease protein
VIRGLWYFLRRRQNLLALGLLALYIGVAVFAPQLAPPDDPAHPATERYVGPRGDRVPRPPRPGVWLGTLPSQLDIYYSLVWGTRDALRFGLVAAGSTALIGVLIGAFSGYAGGLANGLAMRVADALLAFPILAAVAVIDRVLRTLPDPALTPGAPPHPLIVLVFEYGFTPLLIALILFSWVPYARLVNATVLGLKQADFVTAARAAGARPLRIVLRHLLPNVISPAIVLLARDVGGMVLLAATFTYIGLWGGSLWGEMLVIGRAWVIGPGGDLLAFWWVYLPATLALILFGVAWNLLGDGLNLWLNPRTR